MKRSSALPIACFWLLVVTWLAPPPASAQAGGSEVYALIEQGRKALAADKHAESLKALKQAIERPDFASSDSSLQYFAYYLASFSASGVDDDATAHQYIISATRFADADGDTWVRRAGLAAVIDKWDDAGHALTMVATKWPKSLDDQEYVARLIGGAVRELGKQPALRAQRLELLNALFNAEYKTRYGTEPSWFWLILATDAVERKDLPKAREVAKRIDDSGTLVSMRIDKRFDALTQAEPKAFDVKAAAERHARHMKGLMDRQSKTLDAAVQYGYALYTLGKFDELHALADRLVARVEKAARPEDLYEDLNESLNWIYNHKATALRALGRWDESVDVMTAWQRSKRNHEDKVSQAINLGFYYNEMGRPEDALRSVEGLQAADMSGYGRMQHEFVRFEAFQQLGRQREVAEVLAWLKTNQADDIGTTQLALLQTGDVDGAAAMLISRLRDAEERNRALSEIQIYAQLPRTERQKKLDEQVEALLARADVAAAIAEVGRREKQPIYSLEY